MDMQPEQVRSFLKSHRRVEINTPGLVHAGVLILLFPRDGVPHVLLTKRTSDVEHHKGQISFPGGSRDDNDRDITGTALREAEEEIGLPQSHVEVLGLFDDFWTPSGFRITPVIGFLPVLPALKRNTDEVEEIFEVPVPFFLDGTNERMKKLVREGKEFQVYFYTHGRNEIWGATAGMLRSFLRAFRAYLESFPRAEEAQQ